MRFLSLLFLRFCNHQFQWPRKRTADDFGHPEFNSYQTCTECGQIRLFCSEMFEAGPCVGPAKPYIPQGHRISTARV
jgi:hypothetical protein